MKRAWATVALVLLAATFAAAEEIDAAQRQARRQISAEYARIATSGRRWLEDAALYDRTCGTARVPGRTCRTQQARLRARAAALSRQLDVAEDTARRGWLEPGEAREIAQRRGVDESLPSEIARILREPELHSAEAADDATPRPPRRRAASTPRR